MITPSISDDYAEYLRIQISRAKTDSDVNTLRQELDQVVAALYKQHKEKVKAHERRHNR